MTIKEILEKYRKVAVIGFSDNPSRDSHSIALYLKKYGFTVYGVNPKLGGKIVEGINCYKTLAEIPDEVEIIDIFRLPIAVLPIVREAMKLNYKPPVIWTQFGIINDDARKLALENGFEYVENRCILVEHSKIK
ncbi:MAG: CoA-binding protein [Ignavibacteriae bacterium]|nr:CoA-binding protein [Ignavibacteriota bacterium]